jgi:DNA-binding MarR family transcriptional regulator
MDQASDAEPNLGLLLFIPYRFMESAVMDALKAQGHDLTLHQAQVFQRIAPGGSRLAELAAAAQVPKQTIGSIIDQLERAGYVRRSADPHDARARIVTITSRGQELVQISLPVVREVEAAWGAHLGPTRVRELKRALVELRKITDPWDHR